MTSQKYLTSSGLSQIRVDLPENGINFLGSKISDNVALDIKSELQAVFCTKEFLEYLGLYFVRRRKYKDLIAESLTE